MHNETLSADGTKVSYFLEGEGTPIVIVHGRSQHASEWAQVASHLVDRFAVARVDRALYAKARPLTRNHLKV